MGVNHSTKGTETVNAINNLALITGNIGRAGASPFSITGQCNAMGTREAGFTSSLPGYRKFESAADRAELAALWNVDGRAHSDGARPRLSRHHRGRARAARSARSGSSPPIRSSRSRISACCSRRSATSSSSSCRTASIRRRPPSSRTSCCRRRSGARRKAPTPTPSGASARSIAPSRRRARRAPTSTSSSTSPPSSAAATSSFPAGQTAEDAFNEWQRVSAGRLCDYSGMTYDAIEAHGGIQWPFPDGHDRSRRPRARLYTDGSFQTADGRAQLMPVDVGAVSRAAERRVSARAQHRPHRRALAHAHQDRRSADSRAALAARVARDEPARCARAAPRSRTTASTSSRGAAASAASSCALTETIAPGQVFVPFHYAEANANQVTQSAFDPISREPNYKQSAVRVERAERDGQRGAHR